MDMDRQGEKSMSEDMKVQDIFQMAIRSEVLAQKAYMMTAKRINNLMLKERLEFLAGEELKHKQVLEGLTKRMNVDMATCEVKLDYDPIGDRMDTITESTPIGEVFQIAMDSESRSKNLYELMAKMFDDGVERGILQHLAKMEQTHYDLLKDEYELMIKYPDYWMDVDFPLNNLGV